MANARATKETLYVKYEFTQQERLEMGDGLARAHNRMAEIEDEEAVMKSQIKDRKASTSQTIGTLSRNLSNGYELRNISCEVLWDTPNVGEVSFRRTDTGEIVKEKTRVMTETERQMDLPLGGELVVMSAATVEASVAESTKNLVAFFDKDEPSTEEPADPFIDPDPAAAVEAVKAENDEAFGFEIGKPKPGRKPKGFSAPTNPSAIADF